MSKLKLGVDVDGVLASFDTGYRAMLREASGGKELLPASEEPPCWNWATEVGYSKADDARAWAAIKDSPTFWAALPPMPETPIALRVLAQAYAEGHEVYFITHRMGIAPHMQTMLWLITHGFPAPTVLVSGNKGPIAKGLGLTHFIDDKPENCFDVAGHSPFTQVFLLKRRYNDTPEYVATAASLGVTIVPTFKAFVDAAAAQEAFHAIA